MGRSESENAMSNVPPKSMRDLRPSERQFVDAMRRLGHGRFESVRIQRGELVLEPPPTAVRSVKFGKPTPNRPQHPSNAFDLKQEVALDRTQPGLPWKKGRCGTMTHDYKRHGTTTLFAAMNTQDGSVIDVCMPTHNRWDWIRFLKLIDRRTPPDKQLHLIMDNYSGHPCQSSVAVCAAGSPSVETGVGIAARPG